MHFVSPGIKACLFDVFGTVVDWRSSLSRDLTAFAQHKGIAGIDWLEFAVEPHQRPVGGGARSHEHRLAIIATCSNGNIALMVNMAKRAGLVPPPRAAAERSIDGRGTQW
jgi:hypothetical protein